MDIKLFKIEPIEIETDSAEYHDESFVNFQELSAETRFPQPFSVPVPVPPPHIPQSYTCSSKSDATLTFYAADNDNVAPIFESAPKIQFERHIISAEPTPSPEKNIQNTIVQKRIRKKRTAVTTDDADQKYKCQCDQCSKHFTTTKDLKDHLTSVHGRDKPFKCDECGKSWSTRGKLNEHLISHTTGTPHICHICSAEFKRIAGLKQHKLVKHSIVTKKIVPVKVDSRQKKKRKIAALEPEIDLSPPLTLLKVEDGAAPINTPIKYDWTNKCKVCFLTCNSGYTLKHHMKIVHSTEKEKAFQCDIKTCLKKFPTLRKLQIHSCFVHGEKCDAIKIFKCEFCPSQYECKAHLELHIVDKHVEDKDFKCSACSKTFIDQVSLTKHTRANHNTKGLLKNVCHVCAMRFKDLKPLIRHLASVHKRLHYCRKCKHSFDVESDFDQHLDFQVSKTLNLEIQFKCQLCSVTFSSQCKLNTHNMSHTRVLEVKPRNFKSKAGKKKI